MQQVELITSLLIVIAVVSAIARRFHLSQPIALLLVGMIISLIPQIPDVNLAPDTVFFIFLPPLLYVDAFNTPWRELRNVGEVISFQAIVLVLITVALVAVAIHAVVPGMPWAAAFAFGAIVSPTDAVAVAAISKDVILPKRLIDIIKGESLVNDASGLVAYRFAVAAMVTGVFSWRAASMHFLLVAIGGIVVGLTLGWILAKIRTRVDYRPIEVVLSLLSPFVTYLAAEHLHVSGVLSVVSSALLLGWRGPSMFSSSARLQAAATWETISYVLNGFSFLFMGLQLEPILVTVKSYSAQELWLWAAVAAVTPLVARFGCIFLTAPLYQLVKKVKAPSWKNLVVLSWSGIRGVVSLAAALALPLHTASGQPFPFRDLLIFLTIVVISSTLIFQGLTLPYIVRRLKFTPDAYDAHAEERKTRLLLAREALRTIDETAKTRGMDMNDPALHAFMDRYLEQTIANADSDAISASKSDAWHILKRATIEAQRRLLLELREGNQIENEVFRTLQNELDFEEAQFGTVVAESLESRDGDGG